MLGGDIDQSRLLESRTELAAVSICSSGSSGWPLVVALNPVPRSLRIASIHAHILSASLSLTLFS